jgi:virginiamycin A acetyltransferase
MNLLKKIILRIVRTLIGKKGIYGKIGRGNKFTRGVFVEEASTIGKFNYFGPYTMINHAIIENYCSIGPGVKIGQGVHSKDYITTYQPISRSLIGYSLKTSPAKIGSDVWCGANVVIMQGVKIGNGAIIGANAVVTSNIPDYAIAVGVPAKVINFRFDSQTIKEINDSKWYDSDLNFAKEKIKQLEILMKVKNGSNNS